MGNKELTLRNSCSGDVILTAVTNVGNWPNVPQSLKFLQRNAASHLPSDRVQDKFDGRFNQQVWKNGPF